MLSGLADGISTRSICSVYLSNRIFFTEKQIKKGFVVSGQPSWMTKLSYYWVHTTACMRGSRHQQFWTMFAACLYLNWQRFLKASESFPSLEFIWLNSFVLVPDPVILHLINFWGYRKFRSRTQSVNRILFRGLRGGGGPFRDVSMSMTMTMTLVVELLSSIDFR